MLALQGKCAGSAGITLHELRISRSLYAALGVPCIRSDAMGKTDLEPQFLPGLWSSIDCTMKTAVELSRSGAAQLQNIKTSIELSPKSRIAMQQTQSSTGRKPSSETVPLGSNGSFADHTYRAHLFRQPRDTLSTALADDRRHEARYQVGNLSEIRRSRKNGHCMPSRGNIASTSIEGFEYR